MTVDELDRILGSEETLEPSYGLSASVMDAVREGGQLNGWHLKRYQLSATLSISRLAIMNGPTPLYSLAMVFSLT